MNKEIFNFSPGVFSQNIFRLLIAVAVLTATASAQTSSERKTRREQFAEQIRRHAAETKSLAENKNAAGKIAAVNLTSKDAFQNGKDFTTAAFDAEAMGDDEEAYNYTIIDLVYLIDRLDGQPEAAQLQKTLRAVVRGTSTGALVKADIEEISKAYLARQKADKKWSFNAGKTSMNLLIASYMGEDANIKKGLSELQSLMKTAPKGTAQEILNPMNALAKYAAQKTYADEDYTAIYEGVGSIIDAATA